VASGSVGAGLDTSTVRFLYADQDLGNIGVFNDACSLGSSGVPLLCDDRYDHLFCQSGSVETQDRGGKGKGLFAIDYMTGRAAASKNSGSAHYPAESLGAAIGN
nr:hypothetical protein [Tanacetum cinerariifolium]